jgi:hypothetical protein
MQLAENTPAQWESVIADLTAKRQSTLAHLEQLRAEKRSLALDAALGNEEAQKRSQKLSADINKLSLEVDEIGMALTQANGEKTRAESEARQLAERQRQEQLRLAVVAYFREVQKIDTALEKLAQRFQSTKGKLRAAEELMDGPTATCGWPEPRGRMSSSC